MEICKVRNNFIKLTIDKQKKFNGKIKSSIWNFFLKKELDSVIMNFEIVFSLNYKHWIFQKK